LCPKGGTQNGKIQINKNYLPLNNNLSKNHFSLSGCTGKDTHKKKSSVEEQGTWSVHRV
jgi:hypothetical protein